MPGTIRMARPNNLPIALIWLSYCWFEPARLSEGRNELPPPPSMAAIHRRADLGGPEIPHDAKRWMLERQQYSHRAILMLFEHEQAGLVTVNAALRR